jgi:hypothetical protein
MTRLWRIALLGAILTAAALAAACGQPSPTEGPAPAATVAAPVPGAPTAGAAATTGTSWTMPNLVGTNLQEAQDRIQTLTSNAIFVTTSHDETGAGRQQVLDRNWKVCSQNVKPGQKIIASTQIDFGAVKTTESC